MRRQFEATLKVHFVQSARAVALTDSPHTQVGVELNGNFCSVRNVETHEHLFVAFAFHPRSVSSAVSVAFRPDGDNDDRISPYNEALAPRSNSPSRV
jgi:hypothetical protein